MIPFFRKIRWRLARDNQFLKYSRYAIGEIVLVVIGILIALYINNWNEQRKNENKIKEILSEVQRDLLSNLEEIEGSIVAQSTQDSLFQIVLSDTLEVTDLIEHPELINPSGYYVAINIITEGFEKLKSNQDNLPKKFIELYDSIKVVFSGYETNLKLAAHFAELTTRQNINLTEEWKFRTKFRLDGEQNEETLAYFIDNPIHRNRVYQARFVLDDQYWIWLRFRSYDIYKKLARLTGEDNLPDEYTYLLNTSLDEYSGTYEGIDLRNDSISRIISSENGGIRYPGYRYIFYQIKKDSFVHSYNNTIYFKRNSSNEITSAVRYYKGQFNELVKVE